MLSTNDIRTKFLDFFKSKGHSVIASDSLVPKDDPTVLFTTAGMQQFKPQFLGRIEGYTRAVTCQKCLRTDDLDVVGKTDFHHTFFEMLGNFSFGDYFKKEAINWGWEFLTIELKLPKEKLWVSVYKEDDEAYGIWLNEIKIPVDRIVKLGDKSNFWPSNARLNGPNGPCGPCSEIFYDYGVNPKCPQGDKCDPDCSCGRFSEVWNLVFTQFNRKDGGVLDPLPAKNIDTGMGLERLAAVVQGKKSNYETDNFSAILKVIKETFKANNAQLSESEFRIIADHMRAITIGISDGVIPSNEGRGYVIRKLIVDITDLAIRAGIEKPVIHTFVDVVVEVLKQPYPELVNKAEEVKTWIKRTEEAYIKIRKEKGPEFSELAKKFIEEARAVKGDFKSYNQRINELGNLIFLYKDTHGLTLDTIRGLLPAAAIGQEMEDDAVQVYQKAMKVYDELMNQQKERSRAGSKMTGDVFTDSKVKLDVPKTEFVGYKQTKADAKVLQVIGEGQNVKVILDRTPFYAESGGQVGDTGTISSADGRLQVQDTQKMNDIFIHDCIVEQGSIKAGDQVTAQVDESRRLNIMRNHTATHLLQTALRETLGGHIKQQGSLVEEGRLRFDFTHPYGVKPEEMQKIESRLNEFVRKGDTVSIEVLPIEEAKKKGALAFFAEKYGATVRVVSIGDYSREFCGGTHLSSTSQIEAMKIVSEGSVAQGIRRIEAVTGKTAVEDVLNKKKQEVEAKEQAARQKQLEKEKQAENFEKIKSKLDQIIGKAVVVNGVSVLDFYQENIDPATLRSLSDLIKQKVPSVAMVLGTSSTINVSMIISSTDNVLNKGFNGNELVPYIAPIVQGTGGGRPNMVQIGGKAVNKIHEAVDKAKEAIIASLQGTK
jgi:alanyl-tRNA synthetase